MPPPPRGAAAAGGEESADARAVREAVRGVEAARGDQLRNDLSAHGTRPILLERETIDAYASRAVRQTNNNHPHSVL